MNRKQDRILLSLGEYRSRLFIDVERCRRIERTLRSHPATADQVIALDSVIRERYRNFAILISRIEKATTVYVNGGNWSSVFDDVRHLETVYAHQHMELDQTLSDLCQYVRTSK